MNQSTVEKFRSILRHFERELNIQNNSQNCHGVTLAQCHTLLEVSKHSNLTLNKLAKSMHLDKSTVSRTIDGLVNIQLISRKIPKENRRIVYLSLTEQGKEVCRNINSLNNLYFTQVLNELTKNQLDDFISSFEIIVNKMIKLNTNE